MDYLGITQGHSVQMHVQIQPNTTTTNKSGSQGHMLDLTLMRKLCCKDDNLQGSPRVLTYRNLVG